MARRECELNLPLLREIMAYNFAIIETVLYLNTHPEDRNVISLHNRYAKRYRELIDQYQENYGPLLPNYIETECSWRWINDPWPWEAEYL